MDCLRDPDHGCPWDLKQSLTKLKPYLIEECYEALDAIESLGVAADALPEQIRAGVDADANAIAAHRDELGDVLLQVVFQARIAKELGWYDADDVATAIADKMIRRHPHVFALDDAATPELTTAREVLDQWQVIKDAERAEKPKASVLDGVPRHLPSLLRGQKLGEKAARTGFDWPNSTGALEKVDEELAELREAIASGDEAHIEEELGDVLFALASVARKVGVDAEQATHSTLAKFIHRFAHIENQLDALGQATAPLDQLERWWQEAKESA